MSLRPLFPRLHHQRPLYSLSPLVSPSAQSSRDRSLPSLLLPTHSVAHCFSTTQPSQARGHDHYSTLGVSPSASSKEIKAHFYQLSKKYHPDLNKDDEGAKKKFQEVSEAWSVVGNDKGRRDYDRRLRMGGSSSSGSGGPTPDYSYDPTDNASRRARATYAWEYQRRRGDSNRGRAAQARSGRSRGEEEDHRSAYARARGSFGSGPGGSAGQGSTERNLFEKYAAQQRRREEFASSRTSSSGTGGGNGGYEGTSGNPNDPFSSRVEEHETQGASPVIRFIQIIGTLSVIFMVASSVGGGGRLRAEGKGSYEEIKDT